MASSKSKRISASYSSITSGLNSSKCEALVKSSQSLALVRDITFSKPNQERDLLMINEFSYTLNKEKNMLFYWRCESCSYNAILITNKCLIMNKHFIESTGKNDHTYTPSLAEQEIRVFRSHVKFT
ncbi:unnamed protein product [Adineta steineri]|uniref:FLYWCH-type domain-containing protein n=1 Tax=Adineta steineri TaxID=433720 RepID=A0A814KA56_9BILA|nr:unnamed protein product [Adineta steineri]CAF4272140.1 unnamed protein product [Adineta steineri]